MYNEKATLGAPPGLGELRDIVVRCDIHAIIVIHAGD